MVIVQGDLFWAELGTPVGSGPGFRRPVVVIQNDWFNRSRISTTVVCVVTSNLALAAMPGNVRLARGEANLRKRSVVNVSQIITVDKSLLEEKIGSLSEARLLEIVAGVHLLINPVEAE